MHPDEYRRLIGELTAAQAERARSLQELANFDAVQSQDRPRQLAESLAEVDRTCELAQAEWDANHTRRLEEIEQSYRDEDSQARMDYGRRISEVDLAFDAEMIAAEKKYKENCWLLQSILDDTSENSPKVQYERLKSHLEQAKERLSALARGGKESAEQGVALVERRWQRAGDKPQPSALPGHREAAEQAVTAAADALQAAFTRLQRQLIPRLFSDWLILIALAVVLTGGLTALLFQFVQPAWMGLPQLAPMEWAAIAGGVSLGLVVMLLLILWNVAAQQTSPVIERLQQHAVDLQAAYQRWQKFGMEDYRRADHEYRTKYVAMVERRERTLAQYATELEEQKATLETQRREDLAEAARTRDSALRAAAERYQQQRKEEERQYQSAGKEIQQQREQQRTQLTDYFQQETASRDAQRQDIWGRSETAWHAALTQLDQETKTWERESRRQFPEWEKIASKNWSPAEKIPSGIRLGEYHVQLSPPAGNWTAEQLQYVELPEFDLPAVLPFPDAPSLLVKAPGTGRTEAVATLQLAMLRLLAHLPPGDLRYIFIDPVGLGESFASFMHLADYDDLLITHRIWTESAQIEEQLAKLTEHMENVFQKYLRNEFESLEDYNKHAGEVAEPYRILVVADFPAGFTDRAAQRLASIAASGARCGVHTLVSLDPQQPLPREFDLARLEAAGTVLDWGPANRFLNPKLGSAAPLIRDDVPPTQLMAQLIRKLGELSKHIRRVEVPFHRIAPAEDAYWTGDSRSGVDVPLGRAGAMKLQHLQLGRGTSQHVLIAGKTGSGKSTLLHVVITDLALRYSPDQIEFYLIDFKKGVEFKTYAAHKLPHARVIAIESDREFGASVLERLDTVLKERGDMYREVGAQDVKSFREARPDVPLPRILLMVDEFQEFFIEDDKYAQTAALLLDRLVRQGRAFGIHVMLGSQTLGGAYSLARTTVGQMAVRIALQCSESDAHLILSENNGAARLLTRPGEAIYNDANGLVEGNNPFQVAWLDDAQRDGFLEKIRALAEERLGQRREVVVFEGNLPADPAQNHDLCRLLQAAEPARELSPRAWLGDSVAIAGPAEVRFFSRTGANLLIVGQDPNAVFGMLSNTIASLAAQSSGRIELLSDVAAGAHHGRWVTVQQALAGKFTASASSTTVLAEFAAELTRRQQEPSENRRWFLIIDDISQYRELRKSDDDYGFSGFDKNKTATPSQMFNNLLKDGPSVGLHVIVWCDSYNNVDRWFNRQMLREFEMRAVFQMSAADSSNLIDNPAAAKLGNNRAILYSDERGTTMKFRPYGPPSESWLAFLNSGPVAHRDASAVKVAAADDQPSVSSAIEPEPPATDHAAGANGDSIQAVAEPLPQVTVSAGKEPTAVTETIVVPPKPVSASQSPSAGAVANPVEIADDLSSFNIT